MKIIIDFIFLILLYLFVFYKRWERKGREKWLVNTLMYIYISFVLFFTLMPIITSLPFIFNHSYVGMNGNAFDDFAFGRGDYLRQVILNIVMTIPFGFLVPLIQKGKRSFIKTILYCFLFSLSIELLQPLINSSKSSDITDL